MSKIIIIDAESHTFLFYFKFDKMGMYKMFIFDVTERKK